MRATKHGTLTNRGPSTQRAQDIKTSRPLLIIIVLTLWAGTHIFMRHGAKIFSIGVYPEKRNAEGARSSATGIRRAG